MTAGRWRGRSSWPTRPWRATRTLKEPYDSRIRPVDALAAIAAAARRVLSASPTARRGPGDARPATAPSSSRRTPLKVDLFAVGAREVDANPDGIDISSAMGRTGLFTRKASLDPTSMPSRTAIDLVTRNMQTGMASVGKVTPGNSRSERSIRGQDWVRMNLAATALGLRTTPELRSFREIAVSPSAATRLAPGGGTVRCWATVPPCRRAPAGRWTPSCQDLTGTSRRSSPSSTRSGSSPSFWAASSSGGLPEGFLVSHFAVLNHLVRLGDGRTPLDGARLPGAEDDDDPHASATGEGGARRLRAEPRTAVEMRNVDGGGAKLPRRGPLGPDLARLVRPARIAEILPLLAEVRVWLERGGGVSRPSVFQALCAPSASVFTKASPSALSPWRCGRWPSPRPPRRRCPRCSARPRASSPKPTISRSGSLQRRRRWFRRAGHPGDIET